MRESRVAVLLWMLDLLLLCFRTICNHQRIKALWCTTVRVQCRALCWPRDWRRTAKIAAGPLFRATHVACAGVNIETKCANFMVEIKYTPLPRNFHPNEYPVFSSSHVFFQEYVHKQEETGRFKCMLESSSHTLRSGNQGRNEQRLIGEPHPHS
jgi:hypothetical protein